MANKLLTLIMIGVLAAAGAAAYRLVESRIAADVYRQRLTQLNDQYRELRSQYNEAVRKTAVTELLVKDGRLSVIVRGSGPSGSAPVLREIQTPFDPKNEIYVDYVVIDGRLWIRRVFSSQVPADEGVTIDPTWTSVDWQQNNARFGKTIYRSLEEGRWRISVSGDGSLDLKAVDAPAEAKDLARAPELGEFEPVEEEVDKRLDEIGWGEIAKRLFGWDDHKAGE